MSPAGWGWGDAWSRTTDLKLPTERLGFLTLNSLTSLLIAWAPSPTLLLFGGSLMQPRVLRPSTSLWFSHSLRQEESQGQRYLQGNGVRCVSGIINWNSEPISHTILLPWRKPLPSLHPLRSSSFHPQIIWSWMHFLPPNFAKLPNIHSILSQYFWAFRMSVYVSHPLLTFSQSSVLP